VVRNLWNEFKAFAFKGNMIDLAVAVIIGGAFGVVVKSLVDDVFMPLIAAVVPNSKGVESLAFSVNGSPIQIGKFIGAIINFLIVALAVFIMIVKLLGTIVKKTVTRPPAPGEPTVKECPLCLSEIPIKARRCKFCTADLESEGAPAT
jgi:large conductance mechanosensitive channel